MANLIVEMMLNMATTPQFVGCLILKQELIFIAPNLAEISALLQIKYKEKNRNRPGESPRLSHHGKLTARTVDTNIVFAWNILYHGFLLQTC